MLTPLQQSFEQIKKSGDILIALSKDFTADAFSSTVALFSILKKLGKNVSIVSSGALPEKLIFLPFAFELKNSLETKKIFQLSIDKAGKKITHMRYENNPDRLDFFLTVNGVISAEDIRLENMRFNFDLIISLDCPDIESFGNLYTDNPELFFQTPLLNIDHKGSNDQYGQINLIELTTGATSEIVTSLIFALGEDLIDADIATALLCGIIAKTKSFRKNATPNSFILATQLIAKGADRELIVKNLFRTKPLAYLKLLGRILAKRLNYDESSNTVFVSIFSNDFQATGANIADLGYLIEDLENYFPETTAMAILYEGENQQSTGILLSRQRSIIDRLHEELGGIIKNGRMDFTIENTFFDVASQTVRSLLID